MDLVIFEENKTFVLQLGIRLTQVTTICSISSI